MQLYKITSAVDTDDGVGCDVLQVLSTALVKAERENATVYLQRVPNFADLPPIQPYILVKSLPLPDVDASQETLFQTVIPDNRYHSFSVVGIDTHIKWRSCRV